MNAQHSLAVPAADFSPRDLRVRTTSSLHPRLLVTVCCWPFFGVFFSSTGSTRLRPDRPRITHTHTLRYVRQHQRATLYDILILHQSVGYSTTPRRTAPHGDCIVSYRIVGIAYRYRYCTSVCLSHTHQFQLLLFRFRFHYQYQFRLRPSCGSPHSHRQYSLGVLHHFLLIPMPSQLLHARGSHLTQCNVHRIISRTNFGGWMMKWLHNSPHTIKRSQVLVCG